MVGSADFDYTVLSQMWYERSLSAALDMVSFAYSLLSLLVSVVPVSSESITVMSVFSGLTIVLCFLLACASLIVAVCNILHH